MIIENGGCLRIEGDFNAAMWMLAVLGSKLWCENWMVAFNKLFVAYASFLQII